MTCDIIFKEWDLISKYKLTHYKKKINALKI